MREKKVPGLAIEVEEPLTATQMAKLAALASLRYLQLGGPGVTDGLIAAIAGLPRLEVLKLYGRHITDDGLRQVGRIRALATVAWR